MLASRSGAEGTSSTPSMTILDWIRNHEGLVYAVGVSSAVLFVVTLLGVPFVVARLPRDFFLGERQTALALHHPLLRTAWRVARNVLGVFLLVFGIAMLVLPGQGILTLLAALVLLEFPGKQRAELWILRLPSVRLGLNWLRERAGKKPLRLPRRRPASGDESDT